MSRAICTYCSAPKHDGDGLLPATERYISRRIQVLAIRAAWERQLFLILSGEFGLLQPEDPIPWYDHLLTTAEVEPMTARVVGQLQAYNLDIVEYHTAPLADVPAVRPYFDLISAACSRAGVVLDVCMLPVDLP